VLVALGFAMVLAFMALIMTRTLTPMVALILVPTLFGLIAGAGFGLGDMITKSLAGIASTAALLMFAIMFFGIMIDVGLFDPLVRWVTRLLGDDPAKVVVGTALLVGAVSLDGDGSTAFIITTSAMLPLYLRLGMSPVVLTCVAGLMNGTLNIVPWGGPTARAASALSVEASDIFVPLLPSLAVGLALALGFAWLLGIGEPRRLASLVSVGTARGSFLDAPPALRGSEADPGARAALRTEGLVLTTAGGGVQRVESPPTSLTGTVLDPARASLRPRLIWVNLALTLAVMTLLVVNVLPLAFVFMIGAGVALAINFPRVRAQADEIVAHAPAIVGVVSMVVAAAVLVGVLKGTGMDVRMGEWIADLVPAQLGPFFAVITGLLSIPMTFFASNDAFYYGILPILSRSAAQYGISPVEMARASVVGQPVHLQSPLVPAILLLVTLASVNLGDHHRKVLWRAVVVSLAMLAVALLTGAVPLMH